MPGAAEKPLDDSPWYSFDFGPIHFTVMSTEHDFSRGSAQVRMHHLLLPSRFLPPSLMSCTSSTVSLFKIWVV